MKNILIVGGNGQLGKSIVKCLKKDYKIFSLDFVNNEQSDHNLILNKNWLENSKESVQKIKDELLKIDENIRFKSVICSAGGWQGGSIHSETILEEMMNMFNINTMSAVLSAVLASHYLDQAGLLLLTGAAAPFKEATPEMLGYNLAKTATHSLAMNLAKSNQLPLESRVITILPEVIDTQSNRQAMPNADFSQWVHPDSLAGLLKMWVDGLNTPHNASFAIIKSQNGMAVPQFI